MKMKTNLNTSEREHDECWLLVHFWWEM
jgi:hypothetical protein